MAETEVGYYVPRSYIEVKGDRSYSYSWARSGVVISVDAEVEYGVESDPDHWYRLDTGGNFLAETEMALEWSLDGRLTQASSVSVGKAGTAIKGIVKAAVALGGIGIRAAAPEGEDEPRDPCSPPSVGESAWAKFKKVNSNAADRKEKADEGITALSDKILAAATNGEKDLGSEVMSDVYRYRRLQKYLEEESAAVQQVFESWKSATARNEIDVYAASQDSILADIGPRTVRLKVADLPDSAKLEAAALNATPIGKTAFIDDADGSEASWQAAEQLLTVVAVADPHGESPSTGETADWYRAGARRVGGGDHEYDGVVHRIGRPVCLTVFQVHGGYETDGSFVICRLERKSVEWRIVIDQQSGAGYVKFDKALFAKHSAKLGFSDEGTLASVGSSKGSEIAGALGVLGELPEEVAGALETANKIIDQKQALDMQAVEHRIDELTKEKELLEAQIVESGVGRTLIKQRARLQYEIDHYTAIKDLRDAKAALLPPAEEESEPSTLEELLADGEISSIEVKLN